MTSGSPTSSTPPSGAKQIFLELLELPAQQREPELEKRCAGDSALRDAVRSLLAAHESAGEFLAEPTVGGAHPAATASPQSQQIGPYKLLSVIGEGGFGAVWLAEQLAPVRRRVALKVIKPGMDTQQVIARFDAERQALAIMDHPNIARVFDAGATPQGRPYFVMELVEGVPITRYCDRNNLTITQRLELFAQVCQAVQHAHNKGLIHRDIKPTNILITTHDGRPVAKVIDFGIAKATQARLTERTLFTEHGQLVGTPEYMSPEQAGGSLDIDTRTDVYSLGVLLYELLTGTTPFDPRELRSKAYAEIQRVIRDVDPPRPSTRLSTMGEALPSVAARRAFEPRQLNAAVRGDLDWIVMKCLEKDPGRRYQSASAIAGDVMHHLADEPVSAAAPSRAYRIRKFVRRHKGAVIAASTIIVLLVGGITGTTIGLVRASRQRAIAEQQRGEAQKQAHDAKRSSDIADAVARFQSEMLASADPGRLLGDKVTVLAAISGAIKALDAGKLKEQPLVEASVREMIGLTLRSLGRYDLAEPNLRKTLELRRGLLPAGHADIGTSLSNLGLVLRDQSRLSEAESVMRESLDVRRKALPAGHRDIAVSLSNVAAVLYERGKYSDAEALLREALLINRTALAKGDPEFSNNLNSLAVVLEAQGKLDEAEPLLREALDAYRQSLPAGHPSIAVALDSLGQALIARNKLAEAEPLFREALAIRRKALPAAHPDVAKGLGNLATLLYLEDRYSEAEPLAREAVAIDRQALPAAHPDIAAALGGLAAILQGQGRYAEAEPLSRECLEINRKALPPGHPDLAQNLNNLASLMRVQGKLADAEPLYREAVQIIRAALPSNHPTVAQALSNLGRALRDEGKFSDAEPVYREVIAIDEKSPNASAAQLAFARVGLGVSLTGMHRYAEAEPELLKANDVLARLPASAMGYREQSDRALAALYTAWDAAEPDKGYAAKAEVWREKKSASQPATAPSTAPSATPRP